MNGSMEQAQRLTQVPAAAMGLYLFFSIFYLSFVSGVEG